MKTYNGVLNGQGLVLGIVVARFNEFITRRLLDSALLTLRQAGVPEKNIHVVWVPGALEIPFFCRQLAEKKKTDAMIALGCVLRGDTYHYECVSNELTRGVSQVALEKGVPVASGVITADHLEQAIDRAGLKAGNKGGQAALAALEIANLKRQLSLKKETGRKRRRTVKA